MKIKTDAIILDIDGTIWNTTSVVAEAWNHAIKTLNLPAQNVNARMLKKEFGKPMDEIAQSLWPNLEKTQQEKLMAQCCKEEQIALSQNTKKITYAGVARTIKKMSGQFDFYVVSNCQSGYIELTLQKNALEKFIKDSECYGNTKKYKAENLRLLCARNHLKNPVYIGDTEGDRIACEDAGVKFVWASYGFGSAKKYSAKIEHFSQIENLFVQA